MMIMMMRSINHHLHSLDVDAAANDSRLHVCDHEDTCRSVNAQRTQGLILREQV
jgi:hypothetical protein